MKPITVFFRRSSTFVTTIFVTAFAFELTFDGISEKLWDQANKGVSQNY